MQGGPKAALRPTAQRLVPDRVQTSPEPAPPRRALYDGENSGRSQCLISPVQRRCPRAPSAGAASARFAARSPLWKRRAVRDSDRLRLGRGAQAEAARTQRLTTPTVRAGTELATVAERRMGSIL